MAHFSVQQERQAACLICPMRHRATHPCRKTSCSNIYQDCLRMSPRFRQEVLSICHWMNDDDLSYFNIKTDK